MRRVFLEFLVSIAGKVVADEVKEWMAWIPCKLIRWAAQQFQGDYQVRIEEEWLAHSDDLPGSVAKVVHAFGCVLTSLKVTNTLGISVLRLIVVPLFVMMTPVFFIIDVRDELIAALNLSFLVNPSELRRTARLSKAAGGLNVLGLNDLELNASDRWRGSEPNSLLDQVVASVVYDSISRSESLRRRSGLERWTKSLEFSVWRRRIAESQKRQRQLSSHAIL